MNAKLMACRSGLLICVRSHLMHETRQSQARSAKEDRGSACGAMSLGRLRPAAGIRAIIAPARAKTSRSGAWSRRRRSESWSIAERAPARLFSDAALAGNSGIAGAAAVQALPLPSLAGRRFLSNMAGIGASSLVRNPKATSTLRRLQQIYLPSVLLSCRVPLAPVVTRALHLFLLALPDSLHAQCGWRLLQCRAQTPPELRFLAPARHECRSTRN